MRSLFGTTERGNLSIIESCNGVGNQGRGGACSSGGDEWVRDIVDKYYAIDEYYNHVGIPRVKRSLLGECELVDAPASSKSSVRLKGTSLCSGFTDGDNQRHSVLDEHRCYKDHVRMARLLRHSPCPDCFPAWRLGTNPERLRRPRLDERQSLSKYIPSPEALNEATQDFGFNKRAIRSCPKICNGS